MTELNRAPRKRRFSLTFLILAVAAVVALPLLKRAAEMPPDDATQLIRKGAPLIDVRSPGEFAREAIPGAINIPMNQLAEEVTARFPDRGQPLLLHCAVGGRSLMAVQTLSGLGYERVYNLGSLGRARELVGAAQAP
jgi:phage shock protein E